MRTKVIFGMHACIQHNFIPYHFVFADYCHTQVTGAGLDLRGMLNKMMTGKFEDATVDELEAFYWYTVVALPIVACCGAGNSKKEGVRSPDFLKKTVDKSDEAYIIWTVEKFKGSWTMEAKVADKRFHCEKNLVAFQDTIDDVKTARKSVHRAGWIQGYLDHIGPPKNSAGVSDAATEDRSDLNKCGEAPAVKATRLNYDLLVGDDSDDDSIKETAAV